MKKKILALTSVLALAGLTLASCGGTERNTTTPTGSLDLNASVATAENGKYTLSNGMYYNRLRYSASSLVTNKIKAALYKNECIGENISEFDGDISKTSTICEEWANERNIFDFRNKKYKDQTKHFTQMIWKSSQIVGFGFSSSSIGKTYFVSFYFPAGNIFDEFDKNI